MPMSLYLQDSTSFEFLRNYLRAAGFLKTPICRRLGIQELNELLSPRPGRVTLTDESDELGFLIRLFIFGESFETEEMGSVFPARVLKALTDLGLLREEGGDRHRLSSPVSLYPVGDLFIVSDHWSAPGDSGYREDFVFPAITPHTSQFLAALPLTPCEAFLELCSGAAAAALAASSYAQHAWAIDITARSTEMAKFNRLLNGCDNVTVLKGDLYEGVGDVTFDRIVAHPPYMPVLRPAQIFYDGGADGEQITRRIVEALPRFLKPGGCFYCSAQGSDRKGASLEQRVRGWLGEGQSDFDVAVVEKRGQDPEQAALIYGMKSKGGGQAARLMREMLSELDIECMVYGWIIIKRFRDMRKGFTVRRLAGPRMGRDELAWLLCWESFAAGPSAAEEFQHMIPVANASLELRTIHRLKDGNLAPDTFSLHTETPFKMDCRVDPWVGFLIPHCDGQSTVLQLFEICKTKHLIHPEAPLAEFIQLLMVLVSGGFLEVGDFGLPAHDAEAGALPPAQHHL